MSSTQFISRDLPSYQGMLAANEASGNNPLRRVVEWLREDRPGYQNALVYTAVAVCTIALIVSVVGIPVLKSLFDESDKLDVQAKVLAGDAKILQSIGGKDRYESLPFLKLQSGALDVTSEIDVRSMRHSLMQGKDKYERPFLAMKLYDQHDGQQFVQLIYRKFTYEQDWDYSRGVKTVFSGYGIDDDAIKTLADIAKGRHHRYRFV